MKIIICIVFFNIFIFQNMIFANTTANSLIKQAVDTVQRGDPYDALPIMEKAMNNTDDKDLEPYKSYVKLELFLAEKYDFIDLISLYDTLQKANKQGAFDISTFSKLNSIELEKTIYKMIKDASGETLYNLGTKVLYRNKEHFPNMFTINKAIKYFELSEKKGFDDPELYSIFIMLYGFDEIKNYNKIVFYSEKFFKVNKKTKNLSESTIRRQYAIAKLQLSSYTEIDIKTAISELKTAQSMGDEKAVELIASLEKVSIKKSKINGYNSWKLTGYTYDNTDPYPPFRYKQTEIICANNTKDSIFHYYLREDGYNYIVGGFKNFKNFEEAANYICGNG